ncbi:hypothetical protein FHR71_004470 [Methylobacterium sp. RAS18]|nr:hypothetical protein [Methylobacterium sp. RAS18]
MTPAKQRRLIEDNALFQTIGIGLYALVVTLLEEHLHASGDNKEADLAKLQVLLDASVAELRVCTIGNPMPENDRRRIEDDAQQRISSMLDHAYRSALQQIARSPASPSQVH